MIEIRRIRTQVEDVLHEFGPRGGGPQRRAVIAAVLRNPFAHRFEPSVQPMMEALSPLGMDLARRLLAAMRVEARAIESYGKGGIVGAGGESEHGHLWHLPGGYAMRRLLEEHGVSTKAIVPSNTKVAAPGTPIDVPLTHVNASYVRSHFDTIEVAVPGAPAADEIVFLLAMSTGARIHERVGGLRADEIKGEDGLR